MVEYRECGYEWTGLTGVVGTTVSNQREAAIARVAAVN